jgi:hypothetical protein
MSTRERMTWGGKSAAGITLPVEQAAKKASAHPQTPDEGITHPAGYQDPTQPAAYENGDTSSWAEDVHPGPYRTSPAPAMPLDDGGYRHPAAQPGAPAKNASRDLRAATERKASKCLRIASALLGEEITKQAEADDKVAVELIEAQALDLMDLSDDRIAATLRRIEAATMNEEVLLRKMLAGDDESEEEEEGESKEASEEEEEEKKEASAAKRADEAKFAEITSMLAGLQAQLAALQAGPAKPAPVVAETAPVAAIDEEEAMLAAMLAEQAPAAEAPVAGGKSLAQYLEDDMGDVSMDVVDDPMGLFDAPMMDGGDDEILASLFASDQSKVAEEEEEKAEESKEASEEEEAEPEEEEKADKSAAARKAAARQNRTASALRPQQKKPPVGAQAVGTQVRVAGSDIRELASLWESAPDVTKVFGS